jgi:hypothetical protein
MDENLFCRRVMFFALFVNCLGLLQTGPEAVQGVLFSVLGDKLVADKNNGENYN